MFLIFPNIYIYTRGNVIIPTDELIFFRGVCQPPNSNNSNNLLMVLLINLPSIITNLVGGLEHNHPN